MKQKTIVNLLFALGMLLANQPLQWIRIFSGLPIAPVLHAAKNVLEVELKLLKVVPKEFRLNAHHWLILHGRYICTARSPKCHLCGLREICLYYKKITATKTEKPSNFIS